MKIFHFSDSHLGLSLDQTSRDMDFYDNFNTIISQILVLKPDIVIHSGDLFHTQKPSNKAISVAISGFMKLENEEINTIVVAGNHDTPRLSITTHPFEIFNAFEYIKVFYTPNISSIVFLDTNIVTLPHIHDEDLFKSELLKSKDLFKDDMSNIFVTHLGISATEYEEYTDEISGINITKAELEILSKYDYIALGHYHKQFCIKNMCYPGSGEHTSFNQKDYKIGYNLFDTKAKKIELLQTSSRPMIDLGVIDCRDFSDTNQLLDYLENNFQKDTLKDAIVKILLENINSRLLIEFKERDFLNFFKDAFYFEYKKTKYDEIRDIKANIKEDGNLIVDNFRNFFENYPLDQNKKLNLKSSILEKLKDI